MSGSVSDAGPCDGVFSLFLCLSHGLGLGPDPALAPALHLLWSEKSGGVWNDESGSWLHPYTESRRENKIFRIAFVIAIDLNAKSSP